MCDLVNAHCGNAPITVDKVCRHPDTPAQKRKQMSNFLPGLRSTQDLWLHSAQGKAALNVLVHMRNTPQLISLHSEASTKRANPQPSRAEGNGSVP